MCARVWTGVCTRVNRCVHMSGQVASVHTHVDRGVYTDVRVCMRVDGCVHRCACGQVCVHMCGRVYTHVDRCVCGRVCVCGWMCARVQMVVCMGVCVCGHVCTRRDTCTDETWPGRDLETTPCFLSQPGRRGGPARTPAGRGAEGRASGRTPQGPFLSAGSLVGEGSTWTVTAFTPSLTRG